MGWAGPLVVALFAAFLRFDRLAQPKAVVFDETFYVKDALAMLTFGAEHSTFHDAKGKDLADPLILQGNTDIWVDGGSFIAHPPVGKWMIATGEWLFGMSPFGWRFAAAFIGSLSVLVLARVARRMTGSTLLGCAAGLLLAVDGLHLVTSRTGILDIFVMFWVLAAFGCLVADRDAARTRLADHVDAGSDLGPGLGARWWRVAAGVCLGLACGTKWSGVFYVAAFGVMTLVWDVGARRTAGARRPGLGVLARDAAPAFASLVAVAAITYTVSWSGWFASSTGWGRHWADGRGGRFSFVPAPLRSWWHYHAEIMHFHVKLTDTHSYQSWPWDWPILRRPVAFYYGTPPECGAPRCSQAILAVGTPAIWWAAIGALAFLLGWWLVRRDWRAGAIVLGYAAGWLPWFYYALDDRTMFAFYATPMLPFMVLAIVLVLGILLGPADTSNRRLAGAAVSGAYLLVVLANFYVLHPILTAEVISYDDWRARMWFGSWI